jgi:hypothetical protein
MAIVAAGLSASVFAFILAPTHSTTKNQRVFKEGLEIHLPRTSPTFAAMEDALLTDRGGRSAFGYSVQATNEPATVELLSAGENAAAWLAERIARDNKRESSLIAQERASRERAAEILAKEASQAMQAALEKTAEVAISATDGTSSTGSANPAPNRRVYQHPTQTIRLAELKMSREELARELLLPMVQAVNDMSGQSASAMVASKSQPNNQPKLGGLAPSDRQDQSRAPANASQGSAKQQSFTEEVDKGLARQEPMHQLVIAGSLEFAGGLALSNSSDRVVVYRENEEQPMESAAVWLREGRYEVFVEEAVGSLIAELRTPQGEILGRGSFPLENLPDVRKNQYRVSNINLKIQPIPQGITGQVLAAGPAESGDKKVAALKGARIDFHELPLHTTALDEGKFEESSLIEGSSVVLKASRAGFWSSLNIASTGATHAVLMFPDKLIQAFVATAKQMGQSAQNPAETSAVWGRVLQSGQPTEGAQVELLTTTDVLKPIYFNAMMKPDPSLTATGSNGLYAFYPLPPGAHAVQATVMGGKPGEPRLFPAHARTVSRVDIENSSAHHAQVRVFDAFRTDYPLAAEIIHTGETRGLRVDRSGASILRFSAGMGPLMIEASGGQSYERIRLSLNRDRRMIYVPMIQTLWLERIRGALRVNTALHSGTVVGFIQGTVPYQVIMDDTALGSDSRVVYFDSRGEIIRGAKGVPGGGFILFNVSEGFHTVTVQPLGSEKAFATTVLAEPKVTNVINKWIR